jgi:magnesium-protoporphyrin O-methyltransferase
MSCCCPHDRSASRLFSWFAPSYCRRFKKRGLEPSQRQLLGALERVGFERASLLEIGCGVGHLHQTLLERGASRAVGIDLAPGMIEAARAWAAERGLAARTDYRVGDFMDQAQELEAADVVLLDKVLCCYPDARGLVRRSLAKTSKVYAVTYPRRCWYVRLGLALGSFALWLMRSDFRAYLHDPREIEAWIRDAGFEKRHEARTWVWLTQIFTRDAMGIRP